ncbi:hypothetical protein DFH07DRAFT_795335 [Mycena maculata]|uniref:Uncharacterized protein n=1 Tax=Mycena maculata TaxID=230809 RepID=A0AAD7K7D4_9AGAR|nr:hypothetical protein DFH07DRAFT_795335 [Mycena maculata]
MKPKPPPAIVFMCSGPGPALLLLSLLVVFVPRLRSATLLITWTRRGMDTPPPAPCPALICAHAPPHRITKARQRPRVLCISGLPPHHRTRMP